MSPSDFAPLATIIVPIAGGLAFVAYKHPKEFQPLGGIISVISTAILVIMTVWDMSNQIISIGVQSKIIANIKNYPDGMLSKIDDIGGIINGYFIPGWWLLIDLVILGYIVFLGSLPLWLLETTQKPTSDESQAKTDQSSKAE